MKKMTHILTVLALLALVNLSAQQAVPSDHELYVENIVNKLTEKFVAQGRLTFQPGPAPERSNGFDKNLVGDTHGVNFAHWSPDGRHVVTTSGDRTVLICSAEAGQMVHTLMGHTGRVLSAAWSPDGTRVLTGSTDCTARIWDVQTGGCMHIFRGSSSSVPAVAWSLDGTKIATVSPDNHIRICDSNTGAGLIVLKGHTGDLTHIEWSPDSSTLLTASRDNTARIWDVAAGFCKKILRHTQAISVAHWSPDGSMIATASVDGTACIWNAQRGECLMVCDCYGQGFSPVDWSSDSRTIVTVSTDKTAQIWDVKTGESFTLNDKAHPVHAVYWSPDCTKIATLRGHRDLQVYNPLTGDSLYTGMLRHGTFRSLEWSSDSTQIVTKSFHTNPFIFRVKDADILLHNLKLLEHYFIQEHFIDERQSFQDLPLLRLLAELYYQHDSGRPNDRITKTVFGGGHDLTKTIPQHIKNAARIVFKLSDDFFEENKIKKEELV